LSEDLQQQPQEAAETNDVTPAATETTPPTETTTETVPDQAEETLILGDVTADTPKADETPLPSSSKQIAQPDQLAAQPPVEEDKPKGPPLLADEGTGHVDPRLDKNDDDIHWSVGTVDPEHEAYFGRYKSLKDALDAQIHLAKMQGRMVTIPASEGSEDDWNHFYKKIGRPDDPGDYTLDQKLIESLDDGGIERINGFLSEMHKSGARQEVVDSAIDWYQREEQAASAAVQAEREAAHQANLDRLKTEWPGTAYTTNVTKATKALTSWLSHEDAKALAETELADGTLLGKNPNFIRSWYQVGLGMSDATSPIASSGGLVQEYTEAEIDAMQAEAMEKNDNDLRKKAYDARRALYERQGMNHSVGPGAHR